VRVIDLDNFVILPQTIYSAWLDESHDEIVTIMDRRIEAYTGLSMETAEKLQV